MSHIKMNHYGIIMICYREELRVGHKKLAYQVPGKKELQYYYHDLKAVLMGDKQLDIRARLPESNLTVEQQVACLLNQATDPNILGRVYWGWESWM